MEPLRAKVLFFGMFEKWLKYYVGRQSSYRGLYIILCYTAQFHNKLENKIALCQNNSL